MKPKYITLFLSTLQLSACTFGGGFVIVPLMQKKFVDKLHWIDETEMLEITAIAQSSPGAIAVNAAILVGYRIAGIPGALISILGTVLPPLVIISVISLFYKAFRNNRVVSLVMSGMLAGVAAVITDVVITRGWDVLKSKKALPIFTMLMAFCMVRFFNINIMVVILVCAVLGVAEVILGTRLAKETMRK